jgi:hypothetical protein
LNEIIPFDIGEPRQVQIPAQALEEWGLDASKLKTVTAWSLSPKPGAVLVRKSEAPEAGGLYGAGYAGLGRMAVLAFSPAQLGEEQARRSAAFWTRQIAACCRPEMPVTSAPSTGRRSIILTEQVSGGTSSGYNPNDNRYRISTAQNASNKVMEFLYELEQMQPLSIWWVILTLMTLAILLGPVDYFVLKRLDKLPYTWLTSTGWIAVFTVGAYFGVQWLRGGAMELRAVSVLDGIADSNCSWATCYTGLFAPRSGNYHLSGLLPNQWWSGIAPAREEMWAYQQDSGMQQIHCVQVDGGNLPVSLPVNMWTVQPLLSEWTLPGMPFTATVQRQEGGATIEIRNTSDNPIQRGFVLFGDACADVGPVPAHTTQRFDVRTRPFRSWQPSGSPSGAVRYGRPGVDIPSYPGSLSGLADNAFFAQGCLSRTLVMHAYLEAGAALVCVVFQDAPVPVSIKDHTYEVNHVQLARQLVRPKEVEDRGQKAEGRR